MQDAISNLKKRMLSRQYKEGEWDCAIQVAEWAGIVDGNDYLDGIYQAYHSKLSGLRWMENLKTGTRTVADVMGVKLVAGWSRSSEIDKIEIGDLGELEDGSVGIWDGDALLCVAPGRSGYSLINLSHAVAIWNYNPS